MNNKNLDKNQLFDYISFKLSKNLKNQITSEMILIGNNNAIKSAELFDLFLDLENYLNEYNFTFDWPQMISRYTNNNNEIKIKDLIDYVFEKNKA